MFSLRSPDTVEAKKKERKLAGEEEVLCNSLLADFALCKFLFAGNLW